MEPKFILHSPKHHNDRPLRDEYGERIIADGAIGRITAENAYLTAYAKYPDTRRPKDLEVGDCIKGVIYSLSGESGAYDIYRVS